MNPEQIATAIEEFVRTIGAVAANDPGLDQTTDLFDAGYIDSLALVALSVFIEETFGVLLNEHDLFDPGFASISGIARIIFTRRTLPIRSRENTEA